MKLYEFAFSPNCRKVRAVAHELGIELQYVPVDLLERQNGAPSFLAKNPNGRVPVLEDGEFLLWESNAIIRYLAVTKDGSSSLWPSAPREQADVDRWMAWQLAHLAPAVRKVAFELIVKKVTGQGPADQAAIAAGTEEFKTFTNVLDTSLKDKEYVAGRLSIADFALAAFYSLAPQCGLDATPYGRAKSWLDGMLARPSMKHALAAADAGRSTVQ